MALLSVVTVTPTTRDLPDVALRKRCRKLFVNEVHADWFKHLVSDMFETLYSTPAGVGLAANQVGVLLQLAVIDLRGEDGPLVLVNPKIKPLSDEVDSSSEDCMSVPYFTGPVTRHARIKVHALDHKGDAFTLESEGFLARVIQHETDHLHGLLYLDRIPDKTAIEACPGGYPARRAQRASKKLYPDAQG